MTGAPYLGIEMGVIFFYTTNSFWGGVPLWKILFWGWSQTLVKRYRPPPPPQTETTRIRRRKWNETNSLGEKQKERCFLRRNFEKLQHLGLSETLNLRDELYVVSLSLTNTCDDSYSLIRVVDNNEYMETCNYLIQRIASVCSVRCFVCVCV